MHFVTFRLMLVLISWPRFCFNYCFKVWLNEIENTLRRRNTLVNLLPFYKVDNCCNFLSPFLHVNLKRGLHYKEILCSQREQIIPLKWSPILLRRQTCLKELSPLKVYPFTLRKKSFWTAVNKSSLKWSTQLSLMVIVALILLFWLC